MIVSVGVKMAELRYDAFGAAVRDVRYYDLQDIARTIGLKKIYCKRKCVQIYMHTTKILLLFEKLCKINV